MMVHCWRLGSGGLSVCVSQSVVASHKFRRYSYRGLSPAVLCKRLNFTQATLCVYYLLEKGEFS